MARMVEEGQEKRKERVPLGGGKQRLAAPDPKPEFVQRWVNDDPGRIQQALAGGYQFVVNPNASKSGEYYQDANGTSDIGASMSRIVGSSVEGGGKRAYLMEIPKEFYDEDQASKQASIDVIDAQIDRNKYENKIGDRYKHPTAETHIDRPNKPT